MELSLNELLCTPQGEVEREEILKAWSWLTSDLPVLFTAMGDVFVQAEDATVSLLDVTAGELSAVAKNGEEFQALLTDAEFLTEKFYTEAVAKFRKIGKRLNPGKCYGYKQPLVFGGDEKPHNLKIYSIEDYLRLMGEIHEKIKDLPEQSEVEIDLN
ncbi:hypothetical protein LNTAR_03524 [Lentisphaera araneosa HTCC2155]|uniref:T6SS immunity protein Tdi1 C-terminal domain-containing protein n=1 Tax=Lentisphaera araneosa HTCC2155 TaxID=313628 RepID=A6DSR3_9BACT|nr:T6SS immunity protein Tdi1 domain-containing protein [Lentisphaera araneosa]EDM25316.1 hypothetical protein LNTAR_03524 [Lentisphaera araneosa HTCC2155]